MIPWRSNFPGDQTKGGAWANPSFPTSLAQIRLVERSAPKPGTEQSLITAQGNYFARSAISKVEAHGAAGSVPNSDQTAQDSYASLDLWREPSGAHEAAGLCAAAGTCSTRHRTACSPTRRTPPVCGQQSAEANSRQRRSRSHSPVLLQERNQISDSPGVEGGGVELVPELNKIASILELSASSCAFSFSICSISLLSCFILCS